MLEEFILTKYSFKTKEHALREYLQYEYYFLSNNVSLNPSKFNTNSKLYLSSIENYFNLPMILTRSIFSAFDKDNKNFLTKDDYINGFMLLYNGSIDDRIDIIFKILNVNNDSFIHIEDVKCILKYAHIFYNKVNEYILDDAIAILFGRHKVFTIDEFKQRVYKKGSGFFLIMLSLLFENKTFDNEIINLIEDSTKYGSLSIENDYMNSKLNKTGGDSKNKFTSGKNLRSFCLGSKKGGNAAMCDKSNNVNDRYIAGCSTAAGSNLFPKQQSKIIAKCKTLDHGQTTNINNTNTNVSDVHNVLELPTAETIQYLINNFGIDINAVLSDKKCKRTNNNNNNNTSFDSVRSIDDPETEEDLEFLLQFEMDYAEVKLRTDLIYKFVNNEQIEYAIPKGSNDFEMKSGLIFSKLNTNSKRCSMSSAKSFNIKLFNKKKTIHGSNRDLLIASNKSNNASNRIGGNFNNNKDTKHFSSNALLLVRPKNRDSILQTSLSDYMQPQQSSANEYSFNPDSFEEDIFMLKKKNSKIKKYTLLLFKGALFVLKKTHFELNKVKTNNALGAKVFIPTKRLYISSVDYHFQFDGKEYIQVSLVSTLLFKRRNIDLLFDVKNLVNSFVQVFGKFTKYISIENEYTYIKDIGKGSFCQMKLARQNSNGLLYAVKKIKKDVHSIEEFTTLNWEKDIITFLKYIPESKNILKCYDIIETLDNLYIVMEYIAGGSLSSFIRKNNVCLPSSQVKEIVMQIANGLSALHSYGIVHRDLKLENILMDYKDMQTFTAKVIDFGLSQVITPLSKTKETYGTLIYCSPEILLNVPYNYKVDVWSLGVISFYLEYTFMPFGIRGKEAEQEISSKIIMGDLKFPRKVDSRNDQNEIRANKLMMMIIKRCLSKDINQRLTSRQMLSLLMEINSN